MEQAYQCCTLLKYDGLSTMLMRSSAPPTIRCHHHHPHPLSFTATIVTIVTMAAERPRPPHPLCCSNNARQLTTGRVPKALQTMRTRCATGAHQKRHPGRATHLSSMVAARAFSCSGAWCRPAQAAHACCSQTRPRCRCWWSPSPPSTRHLQELRAKDTAQTAGAKGSRQALETALL